MGHNAQGGQGKYTSDCHVLLSLAFLPKNVANGNMAFFIQLGRLKRVTDKLIKFKMFVVMRKLKISFPKQTTYTEILKLF